MTKDVLICGSMAFDTITKFDGFFKDHIMADNIQSLSVSFLVPSLRKDFGGCAGNIAYSLKLLGGNPLPVAAVGQDFGDYQAHLDKHGIEQRLLRRLDDSFTAQCHITTDNDSNQIAAFHPGAMNFSAEIDISSEKAAWAIVAPDAKDAMITHAKRLKQAGIPFIFDLGQAMPLFDGEDLKQMIELASALTANDYECSVIEKRTGMSVTDISKKMQAVVITRGANGADLYQNVEVTHIDPVKPARIEEPTGCGDAHRAGLLYGLTEGWSWEDAARLGNILGSIKIAHQGPQNHTLDLDEVKSVFSSTYNSQPW